MTNLNKNKDLSAFLIQEISPSNKIPPLASWQPKHTTDFDLKICANGDWLHESQKMTRQSLIDLFASVLWAEVLPDGTKEHFLKTPFYQYKIQVEDAPLFINTVDVARLDGMAYLVFGSVHGDKIWLSRHAIDGVLPEQVSDQLYFKPYSAMSNSGGDERLYIDTRFNLTARINRNVFYHLIELGELSEIDGKTVLKLFSGNEVFEISNSSDL